MMETVSDTVRSPQGNEKSFKHLSYHNCVSSVESYSKKFVGKEHPSDLTGLHTLP